MTLLRQAPTTSGTLLGHRVLARMGILTFENGHVPNPCQRAFVCSGAKLEETNTWKRRTHHPVARRALTDLG